MLLIHLDDRVLLRTRLVHRTHGECGCLGYGRVIIVNSNKRMRFYLCSFVNYVRNCTHTWTHTYTHLSIHTYTQTHIHAHIHTHARTHVLTQAHARAHTHTHTHTVGAAGHLMSSDDPMLIAVTRYLTLIAVPLVVCKSKVICFYCLE